MAARWSDRGPITRGQFVTDRETLGSHLVTSFHVTHRKGMVTTIEANPMSSRFTCDECEEDLKEIDDLQFIAVWIEIIHQNTKRR